MFENRAFRWAFAVLMMAVLLGLCDQAAAQRRRRDRRRDEEEEVDLPPEIVDRDRRGRRSSRDRRTRRPRTTYRAPEKVKIVPARDTTFVTRPIREDGTIGYMTYLNTAYSKGVTPANNAATLLLTAIGPNLFDESVRVAALRRAGMAALPLKGDYFVPLETYAKSLTSEDMPEMPTLSPSQAERVRELLDEIRRLTQTGRTVPQKLQDELETLQPTGPGGLAAARFRKAIAAPWKADDYPIVRDWLKANADSLDMLVEASRRRQFHIPLVSPTKVPVLLAERPLRYSVLREATRALCARAMQKLADDDLRGAWADTLAVHNLARLIGQWPTMPGVRAARQIEGDAFEVDERIALHPKLEAKDAREMVGDLIGLPSLPDLASLVDQSMRFTCLDSIMVVARGEDLGELVEIGNEARRLPISGGQLDRHNIDWNRVLELCNEWFDRAAQALRPETIAGRERTLLVIRHEITERDTRVAPLLGRSGALDRALRDSSRREARRAPRRTSRDRRSSRGRRSSRDRRSGRDRRSSRDRRSGREGPYGPQDEGPDAMNDEMDPGPPPEPESSEELAAKIIADLMIYTAPRDWWKPTYHHEKHEARSLLTRLMLALGGHRAANGSYPASLSELAPDYMGRIPTDPFGRWPIRYRRAADGYVLYSVGPNGKDDKGAVGSDIVARAE